MVDPRVELVRRAHPLLDPLVGLVRLCLVLPGDLLGSLSLQAGLLGAGLGGGRLLLLRGRVAELLAGFDAVRLRLVQVALLALAAEQHQGEAEHDQGDDDDDDDEYGVHEILPCVSSGGAGVVWVTLW